MRVKLTIGAAVAALVTVALAGYFFLPSKTVVKTVTVVRPAVQPPVARWSKQRLLGELGPEIAKFPGKQLSPNLTGTTCHVFIVKAGVVTACV